MTHPASSDEERYLVKPVKLVSKSPVSRYVAYILQSFSTRLFCRRPQPNWHGLIIAGMPFLLLIPDYVKHAATETFVSDAERQSLRPGLSHGDIPLLEANKPIERELKAGQQHEFRIQLNQGQFLQITVEQQRIDVEIRINSADGHPLARMDSPYGFLGKESVSLVAEKAGDYIVELRPAGKNDGGGRYTLTTEPLRQALPSDLMRVQAERAFTAARDEQAAASLKEGKEGKKDLPQIEKDYQESLKYWESGDLYWRSKTLYGLASAYLAFNDPKGAQVYYEQALSIQESIQDHRGQAFSLRDLGLLVGRQGYLAKSIEYSKRALPLWQKDNDTANQAGTLNNIAVAYGLSGEPDQAIACHNQVIKIREELGDRSGKAQSLINLGTVYDSLAEPQTALDYYNRALSILVEIHNPNPEDRKREATALNNIGYVYSLLGEPEIALNYYEQALPIRKEVNDSLGEGATLANIGNAYLAKDDVQAAMAHYDQALGKQNQWGQSYTRMNIGDANSRVGDQQKALDQYQQALKLFETIRHRQGEAAILDKMGRVYASLGRLQDADEYYLRALELWRAVRDRRGEATTLHALAVNRRSGNNLLEALKLNETAISIIENLRTGILAPQLRASYFASVRDSYDLEIDLLMQLHRQRLAEGYDRRALETSERSRGRVLLETLGEFRPGLLGTGNRSLIEQRLQLGRELNAKASLRLQLPGGSQNETSAEDREIQRLTGRIETLDAQIRAQDPRYAAVVQPKPLDIKGIQKCLDADTTLLEYALGELRSYLWVVTAKTVASFELPPRAEIEGAAMEVYRLLTARNQNVNGESQAQKQVRIRQADSSYAKAAAALSLMLLGPVGSLPSSSRLLVVPDGKLQYLSFGALVLPTTNQPASDDARISHGMTGYLNQTKTVGKSTSNISYQPLITKYEIIHLPSASVIEVLRNQSAGRTPARKAVAVLADPVFTKDDPRLKRQESPEVTGHRTPDKKPLMPGLSRPVEGLENIGKQTDIPRLFFSGREAESIAAAAGLDQTRVAVGFDASRAMALSDELSQFRIVHFSAHGLVNDKHPELSGIILSLIDKQGRTQDGFLTLNDIYGLDLPAELAVLSACQTAFGKEVRGEGLMSLTRGFMYAGAARVVASLWSVDDLATAELMAQFYRHMLRDGQRPAEALRTAQLELWKEKRWQHPYFWAAFVIQGEWN